MCSTIIITIMFQLSENAKGLVSAARAVVDGIVQEEKGESLLFYAKANYYYSHFFCSFVWHHYWIWEISKQNNK